MSNYFYSLQNGLETRSLEEAFLYDHVAPSIDLSKYSTNPFAYKEKGLYSLQLDYYREIFSDDHVLIMFMENFTTRMEERYKIFDFLGATLPPTMCEDKINPSRRSEVDPAIYSSLINYYKDDRDKLITRHKLSLPY